MVRITGHEQEQGQASRDGHDNDHEKLSQEQTSRSNQPEQQPQRPNPRSNIQSEANPCQSYFSTGSKKKRVPAHSLAGPGPFEDRSKPFVYVHPDYHRLENKYTRNKEAPVWGLAKPLPRVIRPGMKERLEGEEDDGEREQYEPNVGGEEEPASQLEVTPGTARLTGTREGERGGEGDVGEEDSERTIRPMESEVQTEEKKDSPSPDDFLNKWSYIRHRLREPLAEYLATTVSIFIGLCGTLAVSTAENKAGTRISMNLSWGLGYMTGIYIAGGVSGAHLNPAISIALSIFRGFPIRKCGLYLMAQFLGAITAGGLAYCLYRDSILNVSAAPNLGAIGLGFFTEPQSYVNGATAFFDEFMATAILLCAIFAMGDDNNAPPGAGMHSFIIGLLIFVLSICFGFNTGGSFNPARDFGPRLVALMAGYGGHIFRSRGGWWFWGGWVATTTGGLVGAMMYDVFVFVGGESPVNYPSKRRKQSKLEKETKWRRLFRVGRGKVPDLEGQIKDCEN